MGEIGHWKFCIQRESCVISSPLAFYNDTVDYNPDYERCEWYVCYGQERRWKNLSVSVPDHQSGIPLYTTLEVHIEDIFPAPKAQCLKITEKSLIYHCERSELRLHFEWTKVH